MDIENPYKVWAAVRNNPIRTVSALVFVALAAAVGILITGYLSEKGRQAAKGPQQLAEEPTFRPLEVGMRTKVVSQLRALCDAHSEEEIRVLVIVNSGSGLRQELGDEIAKLLQEAGFQSKMQVALMVPLNPPPPFQSISLSPNPTNEELAGAIASALQLFIRGDIPVTAEPSRPPDTITMFLHGDPLFSREGKVRFR
jgi:hypothetical protein